MPSMEYKALLDEAWDLHLRKNAGYAGAENSDPWANFRMCEAFGVDAFTGCLVRLSDKYIRITNLMSNPDNDQVNESIRDTLQDLAAYALIAVCLWDEQHPKRRQGTSSKIGLEFERQGACSHPREKQYVSVGSEEFPGVLRCGVCFREL